MNLPVAAIKKWVKWNTTLKHIVKDANGVNTERMGCKLDGWLEKEKPNVVMVPLTIMTILANQVSMTEQNGVKRKTTINHH